MNKRLLLFWQNPQSRRWMTLGLLEKREDVYTFHYSLSAQKTPEFIPFGVMNDLSKTYEARELFPIFKNRLLAKNRPEFAEYMDWLNLDRESASDMDELSKSGGIRATDNLQLFPYPEEQDGKYIVEFFVHGIRYVPARQMDRISALKSGDGLFLMKDVQNRADALALAIRTDDPPEIIGYCPSFFTQDINRLLKILPAVDVRLTVGKVNLVAPLQYRLLCRLESPWPENFTAFADAEFELNVFKYKYKDRLETLRELVSESQKLDMGYN
ncbi:MAG TPA: HIRAN domain-containing protein [Thiolinea sp.]|nr:HIRAN domain-containing protein [Thiolinea sp.]